MVSIPLTLSSIMTSFNKNIDSFTVKRILNTYLSSDVAKKLYGKSYAEAEEFALSVFRQYILNGPSAKAKNITNMQLRLCGYQTEEK